MASNNPFNYSEWLRHEISKYGGHGTGSDVELGRQNNPDHHEGTQILGWTPNNAALAGRYMPYTDSDPEPGVGVYGQGFRDRGIGVAGTCDGKGVGVYGMALDHGVGVVGRQMAGGQAETTSPVWLVGRTAGVLGHAQDGVGVFGHGGPFIPWQDSEGTPSPLPNPICCWWHLQRGVAHCCKRAPCSEAATRESLKPATDSVASKQQPNVANTCATGRHVFRYGQAWVRGRESHCRLFRTVVDLHGDCGRDARVAACVAWHPAARWQ
jgi:hypothetical protein